MSTRIARDRRRAGIRAALGARDEALLRGLARLRLARTDDLIRLFFSKVRRDTAAARLRRLHDAGFLQAISDGPSTQNCYHLGPVGVRWAEDHGLAAGAPPARPHAHHLGITSVWSRLAAALAEHSALRLARFESDAELRARFSGVGAAIMPDAAIEIAGRSGIGGPAHRLLLEVDLGSERHTALARKLSRYDPSPFFLTPGPVGLVVVLVGAGGRRVESVRALVARYWIGDALVCALADWPAALLGRLAQAPLADSPDGKGSPDDASPQQDPSCDAQGEGLSR